VTTEFKRNWGVDEHGYMTPDHPDAFLGLTRREPRWPEQVPCAQCKGYGSWNAKLNVYDRYENGVLVGKAHFRQSCSNCNDHGWVDPKYEGHIHKWRKTGEPFKCCETFACDCGATLFVDSGD